MKNKVGQSCDVGIFVGFCFSAVWTTDYRSVFEHDLTEQWKKKLATRQSLKFNIRGEVWLQKEPASQTHEVDPRLHPTLNQRLDVELTLFQAVSLLCAWLEGFPFGFEGGILFSDKI